jgi:hypothetical protein
MEDRVLVRPDEVMARSMPTACNVGQGTCVEPPIARDKIKADEVAGYAAVRMVLERIERFIATF